ncbi:MAG: 4Fe-4S binding protein [Candidatus Lokiarchaeota archaeon]|nr:4Fe-4S binding protein [Candidatus Lokiarchaeota archaeon]
MSADAPPDDSNACPSRTPVRSMDVNDDGAMLHSWKFSDHVKTLIFHMEKCIGCDLCRLLCPTSCIELGPMPEIASGKLEGVPPILINHETCAYCGLCASICPTGALGFGTDPADFITLDELPRFYYKPLVEHIQQRMKRSFDYPASSKISIPASIKKPSEGKVLLRGELLDKCDPMGCKGCLQICPTNCFWVPRKAEDITARGKITMDEELCIHCGACRNACPHRIIEVTRTKVVHHLPVDGNKPWLVAWRNLIQRLVDAPAVRKSRAKLHVAEEGENEGEQEPSTTAADTRVKTVPKEILDQLDRDFEAVKGSLAQVNTRYWIEFKKIEPLRKALAKVLPART